METSRIASLTLQSDDPVLYPASSIGGHFNPSPSHDDIRTQDPYLISGLHAAAELPRFFLCRHRPFRHQFTISPMQFPPT